MYFFKMSNVFIIKWFVDLNNLINKLCFDTMYAFIEFRVFFFGCHINIYYVVLLSPLDLTRQNDKWKKSNAAVNIQKKKSNGVKL